MPSISNEYPRLLIGQSERVNGLAQCYSCCLIPSNLSLTQMKLTISLCRHVEYSGVQNDKLKSLFSEFVLIVTFAFNCSC